MILTAGALATPQILQLSGIGPAAHLRQHGIDVVADLPGVGENYQDHLEATVQCEIKDRSRYSAKTRVFGLLRTCCSTS